MTIEVDNSVPKGNGITFGDLAVGQAFRWLNGIYVKCEPSVKDRYNAVSLLFMLDGDGWVPEVRACFSLGDALVRPVKLIVRVVE